MMPAPRSPLSAWPTWLPALLLLLLGGLAILAQYQLRLSALGSEQAKFALQAATLASQGIDATLANQRHLLQLFVREHAQALKAAVAAPDSAKARAELERRVLAYFPGAFAHTLANRDGQVVLDDFEGLVGDLCRKNIQVFARTSNQHLILHPNPSRPHYDVMTRFGDDIFFVSFDPDNLSRILADHELPDHGLLLLKRDAPQVEITRQGHRLNLGQAKTTYPARLDAATMASMLASVEVPDTDWRVIALPSPEAGPRLRRVAQRESLEFLGLLAAFALGFQLLLNREHRGRRHAEEEAVEMATLGFVDALTGLPNRRALDEDLAREWLNLERSDEPLSMLMIDLDHFKDFNDTYGHLAGDHALRVVAQAMRASLRRPRDRIARFGGEEFAILLPNTPCLAAKLLADALHEAVREAFRAEADAGVTISIGISCAHAGQLGAASELLELADQALYGAKGAGRDTTVVIPAGP